jgi:hypothetical protein
VKHDKFGVRRPDTPEGRDPVSMLVNRMYAWRGYGDAHDVTQDPNRITLTATDKGDIVGTLSIGIDSPIGLRADDIFKDELDDYRDRGARLCEITKLAFDHSVQSKVSLANLFHLAVIYARDIHGCTDAFIEVNPRHRRFYERMLGFRQVGGMKKNPRVNAPAYLLHVNVVFVTEQIRKHGGTYAANAKAGANADANAVERSFYSYFFAPHEERAIINRLLRIEGSEE